MATYGSLTTKKVTVQSEKAKPEQILNSAGGYVFSLSAWDRFDRFLILGSTQNTFYQSAKTLTKENVAVFDELILSDGVRFVARIAEISKNGRAPRNTAAVFALAYAQVNAPASDSGTALRSKILEVFNDVVRTSYDLYYFVDSIKNLGSFTRSVRKLISGWYAQDANRVAYQVAKYQSRAIAENAQPWTHRDVLRLNHVKPITPLHNDIFRWVAKEVFIENANEALDPISGLLKARKAESEKEIVDLIKRYKLTHEMVPNQFRSKDVWLAMLPNTPANALLRNLGNLGKNGVINALSTGEKIVVGKLGDPEYMRKAHPIDILTAIRIYGSGRGLKGDGTWEVNQRVMSALDSAFEASFARQPSTGKNILVAVDVSGSMDGARIGTSPLTARDAATALAVQIARTEKNYALKAFSHRLVELPINDKTSFNEALGISRRIEMGGTDCSLPMTWAAQENMAVDAFIVITDCETWFGNIHPFQALKQYRKKSGRNAKLIVIATSSNGFTIADLSDGGCLDVVGFDSAALSVVQDFIKN